MAGYSNAKKVLAVYVIGVLGILIILNTPIVIPCIFLMITGIPCPACGITRAFILLTQFEFINAFRMNILAIPLAIGAGIYFVCTLVDVFYKKNALQKFNSVLANKWVIVAAVLLMLTSWGYNLFIVNP